MTVERMQTVGHCALLTEHGEEYMAYTEKPRYTTHRNDMYLLQWFIKP